jgi:hypothetical protein
MIFYLGRVVHVEKLCILPHCGEHFCDAVFSIGQVYRKYGYSIQQSKTSGNRKCDKMQERRLLGTELCIDEKTEQIDGQP